MFATSEPYLVIMSVLSRLVGGAGPLVVVGGVGALVGAYLEVPVANVCWGTDGGGGSG